MVDSRGLVMTGKGGRRILLIHGNARPRVSDLLSADVVFMGHTHPAVRIRDPTGYTVREPVILRISVDKGPLTKNMYGEEGPGGAVSVVVLPAFNPLMVGVDVVDVLSSTLSLETIINYMGPMGDNVEVYMTDMTYLGTLNVLRKIREENIGIETDLSWL
jgi:metallophosphoesterase superfamily enzyme